MTEVVRRIIKLDRRVDKSADEARNSTTTLTVDSSLHTTLRAGKKYRVHGVVFMRSANATMDLKYSLDYDGAVSSTKSILQRHIAPGGSTETIIGT